MGSPMTCAEADILLADYVDGNLHGERKSALETHIAGCTQCREMESDVRAAAGFLARAEVVQAPPELVTRILFHMPRGKAESVPARPRGRMSRWLRAVWEPILQPRFVMGMAMTILSFSMLGRFTGISVRQLNPADLNPVKVWTATEDQIHRAWNRVVKYYENIRLVYEIQSRLKEWAQEEEERRIQQLTAGEKDPSPVRGADEVRPKQ